MGIEKSEYYKSIKIALKNALSIKERGGNPYTLTIWQILDYSTNDPIPTKKAPPSLRKQIPRNLTQPPPTNNSKNKPNILKNKNDQTMSQSITDNTNSPKTNNESQFMYPSPTPSPDLNETNVLPRIPPLQSIPNPPTTSKTETKAITKALRDMKKSKEKNKNMMNIDDKDGTEDIDMNRSRSRSRARPQNNSKQTKNKTRNRSKTPTK